MRESAIEEKCRKHALRCGFTTYKLQSHNHIGAFDRIYVGPNGSIFFVEHKQPHGRKRPHQILEQERLHRLGHIAEFCWTFDQFVTVFHDVRAKEKRVCE